MAEVIPVEHNPFSALASVPPAQPNALGRAAELSSYSPTWRDRIATLFMGDERASPARRNFVSGLFGSTGLGSTGMGLVDFTPAGIPLAVQESAKQGDLTGAAVAATPFGVAARPMQAAAKDVARGIRAYHGSPHDFDRFDLSKIGTGEGSQAYGHGVYFAENPNVARKYKERLSANAGVEGRTYEVNINAHPEQFLDWDKPLGEQPAVYDAIRGLFSKMSPEDIKKAKLASRYGSSATTLPNAKATGEVAVERLERLHGPEAASAALRQVGVPGVKYLDQGSRIGGDGTRNYVVFDDKLIDILKKYGVAGLSTAGLGHLAGQNVLIPVDHDPFEGAQ